MHIPTLHDAIGAQRQQDRDLVQGQQHDYACATPPAIPNVTSNTTAGQTGPRTQAPPCPTLSSTSDTVFASPELSLGYLLHHESRIRPLRRHGARQEGFNRHLGKTSVAPELGSKLNIRDKGHRKIIKYRSADETRKRLFCHTRVLGVQNPGAK